MGKTAMNKIRRSSIAMKREKGRAKKAKYDVEQVLEMPKPTKKAVRKMQREQRRIVRELSAVGITKEDLESGKAAEKAAAMTTSQPKAIMKLVKKPAAKKVSVKEKAAKIVQKATMTD